MPTEPNKEALESIQWLLNQLNTMVIGEPVRNLDEALVGAERAVEELKTDRQRWEQEVRERLEAQLEEEIERENKLSSALEEKAKTDRAEGERIKRDGLASHTRAATLTGVLTNLDSIFGEAEPVEGDAGRELGRLDLGEGHSKEEAEEFGKARLAKRPNYDEIEVRYEDDNGPQLLTLSREQVDVDAAEGEGEGSGPS